ncbi:MAG: DegV family protein, partial [Raoultibacter sp.]
MKIVSDSSIMLTVAEGAARDIDVLPLAVTIGDETWLEYEDISSEEFLKRVRAGGIPQSASP